MGNESGGTFTIATGLTAARPLTKTTCGVLLRKFSRGGCRKQHRNFYIVHTNKKRVAQNVSTPDRRRQKGAGWSNKYTASGQLVQVFQEKTLTCFICIMLDPPTNQKARVIVGPKHNLV